MILTMVQLALKILGKLVETPTHDKAPRGRVAVKSTIKLPDGKTISVLRKDVLGLPPNKAA